MQRSCVMSRACLHMTLVWLYHKYFMDMSQLKCFYESAEALLFSSSTEFDGLHNFFYSSVFLPEVIKEKVTAQQTIIIVNSVAFVHFKEYLLKGCIHHTPWH